MGRFCAFCPFLKRMAGGISRYGPLFAGCLCLVLQQALAMQIIKSSLRRILPLSILLIMAGIAWTLWSAKIPGGVVAKLGFGAKEAGAKDPGGKGEGKGFNGKGGPPDQAGGGGRRGGGGGGPVSAGAVAASTADVQIVQTGLGSVVSRNSVIVRSRVNGQLTRVLFKEGQFVHAGDTLAEIDPRPFQVQLTQMQGQIARDQALLANARRDVERFKALLAKGSVSSQQVDAQESLVKQYEGVVLADQGQVDSAQLQLSFTKITAPLTGRIGLRLIDAGNNISATDPQGLAVINETQPVTVVFALPEDNAPAIIKRLRETETASAGLPVEAWDRSNKSLLAKGSLLTIDNQIDPASGTIKLKAVFANTDNALIQNQFVNARLLLDTRQKATVIPSAAVQRGSAGPFVYAVKEDKSVSVRPITLGPVDGENVAIETGLAAGDIVVVTGADKLREGAKIEVTLLGGEGGKKQPSPPAPLPQGEGGRKLPSLGALPPGEAGKAKPQGGG
jgi:multidrug efflux system membrane fusion protein